MISNGKDIKIGAMSNLPQVSEALLGWFQAMTFYLITKSITDFDLTETKTTVTTKGVRQPFSAQQLALKPEGQRAWKWETLHCLPDVKLNPDDIVVFNAVKYRVMEKLDYSEYGYLEYHIIQDYTEPTPEPETEETHE